MSITLTTAYTVIINSVQMENDTVGACTGMSLDYLGNILTYTFQQGSLVGNPANLVPGTYQSPIVVTVNLVTGAWADNHGHSGTIPSTILNPIVTQLIGNRNSAEGFMSVSGGLMPGTQVPWTAL